MKNICYPLIFFVLLNAEPLWAQTSITGDSILSPLQSVCNTPCYNINFQSKTLNGWDAYYAQAASSTSTIILNGKTGGPTGSVVQAGGPDPNTGNSYHVNLMTAPGSDPIAGSFIPYTPPLGGLSAMIGDGSTIDFGVGILEQTYLVDPSAPILTLQYAVVLENAAGHTGYTSPWFKMEVLDQNGNPISGCGQYFVIAGPNLPGYKSFYYSPSGDSVLCKPWTTAFVPLYNYIGQCITVRFTTSDCALGGHFGYAYVAATCSKIDLLSTGNFCTGQQSATITGPPGAMAYQWTTSTGCISGSSTGQSIKVTCGGTYILTVQTSGGVQCADTFSIIIPIVVGQVPTPCFIATRVCVGNPTSFNGTCSSPSSGNKYYWDFYNSGTYNDSSGPTPVNTFNTAGTYSVRLHIINANGCEADTSILVIVDPNGSGLSTYFTTVTNTTTCGACNGKISFNIKGGNIRDTLKTSFDNTWAVIGGGISPYSVGGTKNCGAILNANGLYSLSFCNLCAGVYHFYIIPSSVVPSLCSPGFYGDTIIVAVNSPGAVIPTLHLSNDTIYSTHASSYQWYLNGFPILNATDSFYVFNQTGTYNVFTIDSNSCGHLSNPLLYTAISSMQSEAGLKVYPNPAVNEIRIESPELLSNNGSTTLTIYNILGENVYRTQPQTTNSKLQTAINVSLLAKGVYFVQLTVRDKTFRTKFVKE